MRRGEVSAQVCDIPLDTGPSQRAQGSRPECTYHRSHGRPPSQTMWLGISAYDCIFTRRAMAPALTSSDVTHLLRQYTHAFPMLRLTLFLFLPPDSSSLVAPSVTSAESTRFIAALACFAGGGGGWAGDVRGLAKSQEASLEGASRLSDRDPDAELCGDCEMYGGEVGS
jgi:hypothetical protein